MRLVLALLSACALGVCTLGARAQNATALAGFVRVEAGRFVLDGRPYHFSGANLWYGMHLGADAVGGDRARLARELDSLAARGLTNLRVMGAAEGPDTEPLRVHPTTQPSPGVYDERVLRGLDVLLAGMGARGMKAVVTLNNFFMWSGGMAQYVSWAEGTPIPYPSAEPGGATWDDFQNYAARFYANPEANRLFDAYLTAVVNRTNTVTGVRYRDDPAIMAWQLANEPRGFAETEAYLAWIDHAAGLIHRLDPNHLVSLGGEGKLQPGVGTAFERAARSPHLDYLTAHVWIENWGWYRPAKPDSSFAPAVGRALGYVADHAAIARAIGKPLVLEEFGVGRDGGALTPGAPALYRDVYYTLLLEALLKLAQEGPGVGGANVWGWAGEGVPPRPGGIWAVGDPLGGDPPHEQQGWYAFFFHDRATLDVLRRYAAAFSAIGQTP